MTDRVDTMYAFLVENEDGEGIPAFLHPETGMMMPMVAADKERVEQLRPMAQMMANHHGKTFRLTHFTTRTDVEVIEPDGGPQDPFVRTI